MNLLHLIDEVLLFKVFQPFAHWFQKWTGKNNFWLARICCIFCFSFVITKTIISLNASSIISGIFEILGITVFWLLCYVTEEKTLEKISSGLANEKAYTLKNLRSFLIIAQPMNALIFLVPATVEKTKSTEKIYFTLVYMMCVFYFLALYFHCCTPLPPSKSKLKEFMERLRQVLTPQMEPCPASS